MLAFLFFLLTDTCFFVLLLVQSESPLYQEAVTERREWSTATQMLGVLQATQIMQTQVQGVLQATQTTTSKATQMLTTSKSL